MDTAPNRRERAGPRLLGWLTPGMLLILPFAHTVAVRHVFTGLILIALIVAWTRCSLPLARPASIWLAYALLSALWSPYTPASAHAWLDEAFYPLVMFYAFRNAAVVPQAESRLSASLCAGIAILALLSLAGYTEIAADTRRPGLLYYYPGVGQASTYAAMALPVFAAFAFEPGVRRYLMGALGIVCCLFVGAASLNRMFWPTVLTTLMLISRAFGSHRARKYVAIASALGVLVASILVVQVRFIGYDNVVGLPSDLGMVAKGIGSDDRPEIWHTFSVQILKNPWFGVGFGKTVYCEHVRCGPSDAAATAGDNAWEHAHNLIMNTALQTGIVGVIVLLWLLGSLAARFYHARAQFPGTAWAGVALVIAMLVKTTTDDHMRDSVAMYFWALSGWLLARIDCAHAVRAEQPMEAPDAARA
jgi:O-antigen ligase